MTQLFDTTTYADRTETGADHATQLLSNDRHLRSMPTGDGLAEAADRSTQWRLDDDTIATGRKGIQAARQALQDAARDSSTDKASRKAA